MRSLWICLVAMAALTFVSGMDIYYLGETQSKFQKCGQKASLQPEEMVTLMSEGGAPNGECTLEMFLIMTTRCDSICVKVKNFTVPEDFVSVKFESMDPMREETLSISKKAFDNNCFEGNDLKVTVTDKPGIATLNKYYFDFTVHPNCPGPDAALTKDGDQDAADYDKREEFKQGITMNYVHGIVVGICLACVFLVILLITYCYYKNQPYTSHTYSGPGFKAKMAVNEPGSSKSQPAAHGEYKKTPEAEPLVTDKVAMSELVDETKS